MEERTRAWRRHNDFAKAIRKRSVWDKGSWYDNLHQYSKNKIHCSCPMCRSKTKNNFYGPAKHYNHSDMIKMLRIKEQINEQAAC